MRGTPFPGTGDPQGQWEPPWETGAPQALCPTLGCWGATGEPYWDPWGWDTGAPSLGVL